MAHLNVTPNLLHVDDIYQRLIDLHAGQSVKESLVINARLILALANHIGDEQAIREAIAIAANRPVRGILRNDDGLQQ